MSPYLHILSDALIASIPHMNDEWLTLTCIAIIAYAMFTDHYSHK